MSTKTTSALLGLIKAADAVTDAATKGEEKAGALWDASKALFIEFKDGGEAAFNTAIIARRIKRGLVAAEGWKTLQTKDADGNDAFVFRKPGADDVAVALRMRKLPDGAVIEYTPDKGDGTANTYKGVILRAIKSKLDWEGMTYSAVLASLKALKPEPKESPTVNKSPFQRCNDALTDLERYGPEVSDVSELAELARRIKQLQAMMGVQDSDDELSEQGNDDAPAMPPPTATKPTRAGKTRKAAH